MSQFENRPDMPGNEPPQNADPGNMSASPVPNYPQYPQYPQPPQYVSQPVGGPPPGVYPTPQVQVQPKNPGVAAVLSAVWTGAGQIYNGQIGLGLGLMFLQFIGFLLIFVLIGLLTLPAVWLFGIFQAYSHAKGFNTRHGIIS